ncbi:MAG: ATP-binding protein [Chloroflexi bacterium]|nr:ATP-binding protein [Chloroflexota bacterium]MCI0645592.1 ATP-binding protein [Chloroflexota bacterium]
MSLKTSLSKIIYAYQTGRHEQFLQGIREIIADERRQGHNRVADELEQALAEANLPNLIPKPMQRLLHPSHYPNNSKSVPASRGDNLPLIEVKHPNLTFDDVILNGAIQSRIDRIVREQTARYSLAQYGLHPISRVLFYGPSGCGKTLTAHVLAGVLGWPLLYTRYDSVISSYLGETSVNLHRVFDFAVQGPCILFFDEFDIIGKSREGQSDVGELKRVVNTFLQMLDNYRGESLIIAATNHETLLDYALWQRFDEVVCFSRPAPKEIEALLRMRLGGVRLHDFAPGDVVSRFNELSHNDITRICIDALKQMVLTDRASLTEQDILDALSNYQENRPIA